MLVKKKIGQKKKFVKQILGRTNFLNEIFFLAKFLFGQKHFFGDFFLNLT